MDGLKLCGCSCGGMGVGAGRDRSWKSSNCEVLLRGDGGQGRRAVVKARTTPGNPAIAI